MGYLKEYIYINSYPRSGSTFIETACHFLYNNSEDNSIALDLVAKVKHDPELLKENLNGILQVSILRDPAESIASFMVKDIGRGEKVLYPDRSNRPLNIPECSNSEEFNRYIDNKIKYFYTFLNCISSNINNILIFDFMEITNNTEDCLKVISENMDINPVVEISDAIDMSIKFLKNQPDYNIFSNSVPINKPKLQNEYVWFLNNYKTNDMEAIRQEIVKVLKIKRGD